MQSVYIVTHAFERGIDGIQTEIVGAFADKAQAQDEARRLSLSGFTGRVPEYAEYECFTVLALPLGELDYGANVLEITLRREV